MTKQKENNKDLEKENKELKQENEKLKKQFGIEAPEKSAIEPSGKKIKVVMIANGSQYVKENGIVYNKQYSVKRDGVSIKEKVIDIYENELDGISQSCMKEKDYIEYIEENKKNQAQVLMR